MRQQPIIDADFTVLDDDPAIATDRGTGRSLMLIGAADRDRVSKSTSYPNASFVTHLIAMAANTPQTRHLRRASPQDALASYQGTIGRRQDDCPAIGRRASLVA